MSILSKRPRAATDTVDMVDIASRLAPFLPRADFSSYEPTADASSQEALQAVWD